jgi:dTDP-4-dehydrorhamnose reductase
LSNPGQQKYDCLGVVHSNPLSGAPFPTQRADLSQPGAAARILEEYRPDVLIHCAAIANLDACEADPGQARRVNAELPAELAGLCALHGVRFVHISTDAVFDGLQGNYTETDQANPINIYAETKLAGELGVAAANPQAIIARVNFYGWSLSGRRSLAEMFVSQLSTGKPVMGFNDVFFCPLQVNDLADLLLEMATKNLSGLFHAVSPEWLSKEEFGRRIALRFGLDEGWIRSVSVREGGLRAARSPNLILRSDKLSGALGHNLPGQEQGLERFYSQWRAGAAEKIKGFIA